MATPVLIDLTNYDTLLVQSTAGRGETPDGNIFFDVETGEIQLISASELAMVDLGSGPEANPLTNALGITMGALYAFERQERRTDEVLRQYDLYFVGSFKFAGAYELANGRKFDATDRRKIRGSGWIERSAAGTIDRIYFGNKSLSPILAGSQPYYQLSAGGAPVNYEKTGPIDEAVQVFGDSTYDTGAGDFDTRTYEALSIRTYGQNHDRKILADSGVAEMGGYATGFALGESPHLTTDPDDFPLVDVYGGAKVSPWTGMTLEKLSSPQNETGFNEAAGNFSWVLNNTAGGTLAQCVAFLDALAQTDDDIDSGTQTVTHGKRVNTWYTYNAAGKVVTRSGADALGLFIENLPAADEQSIVFTDDTGALKTRPFNVSVEVEVGALAVADPNAWYHCYFATAFNSPDAVTVEDKDSVEVKGNVATDATGTKIIFTFAYDSDTLGGTAGTDKAVVFEVEGDGGATAAQTEFTITRIATVTATCAPGLESNV
jgi:hypothetical protein